MMMPKVLLCALGVWLCVALMGCRKEKAAPADPSVIGGVRLGKKYFPRNGEGREILLNEIELTGCFRLACGETIPFDHRLYAIRLIAPEIPPEEREKEEYAAKIIAAQYGLSFRRTPEGLRAEKGDLEVTVSRDYRFGPDAVSVLFRLRSLAALAQEAKTTPEYRNLAKRDRVKEEIAVLEAALHAYHQDMGHYPGTLAALFQPPALAGNWQGPYLEHFSMQDPWGNDYRYFCFPDGQRFELFSGGENGKDFLR